MAEHKPTLKEIVRSLGLVFGDIGTSPIYTLSVIFLTLPPTRGNVMGVLSLVFWTMSVLVTLEYSWLAMSLGKRGEGGTIVLKEILAPMLRSPGRTRFVMLITYLGISLIIGDGVITPAISILSAVEGLRLVPGFEHIGVAAVLLIASAIAVALFAVQSKGTDRISGAFGPIMVVWFIALAASGIASLVEDPSVALALSPHYALAFFRDNGLAGFFILSEVILCATGGEALYADMGHLGRQPIISAWKFAFTALLINYLGQGAYLLAHPDAKTLLFESVRSHAPSLYVPFLLLTVMATVIASQAMISGMFSIVFQGISTGIMPLFHIEYTSKEMQSQIYIAAVNWFLLASVIFVMYEFRESGRLAAAYGLAVTGTMSITGVLMTWIFSLRREWFKSALSVFVTIADIVYLGANTLKIPHGGYWSLILAAIPMAIILIYTNGQRLLYQRLKPMRLGEFIGRYEAQRRKGGSIEGTALFFLREASVIPPYISRTMLTNGIIYKENIFVSVIKRSDPFGLAAGFRERLADGLIVFEVQIGYMELIDLGAIIHEAGIAERAIFYGIEDITTRNVIWKAFDLIKRNTPTFVRFHMLPAEKMHGVMTQIEL